MKALSTNARKDSLASIIIVSADTRMGRKIEKAEGLNGRRQYMTTSAKYSVKSDFGDLKKKPSGGPKHARMHNGG